MPRGKVASRIFKGGSNGRKKQRRTAYTGLMRPCRTDEHRRNGKNSFCDLCYDDNTKGNKRPLDIPLLIDKKKLRVWEHYVLCDTCYLKIHNTYEDKYDIHDCFVANSRITGAGYGLYAARDFDDDEWITGYNGVIKDLTDELRSKSSYLVLMNSNKVMDGDPCSNGVKFTTKKLGAFCNDVTQSDKDLDKNLTNARLVFYQDTVHIYAIRKIKAGEEIFILYNM